MEDKADAEAQHHDAGRFGAPETTPDEEKMDGLALEEPETSHSENVQQTQVSYSLKCTS